MVLDIRYLPSVYKTQVEFRSHFLGKKVRRMVREIRYILQAVVCFEVVICTFNSPRKLCLYAVTSKGF